MAARGAKDVARDGGTLEDFKGRALREDGSQQVRVLVSGTVLRRGGEN